jgi:hypothetical protein
MDKKVTREELENRLRELAYEDAGRKKLAEERRYLAKFARHDTAFIYLNLDADQIEGKI